LELLILELLPFGRFFLHFDLADLNHCRWACDRVSLFRSFLIFASKRNEAKRILFCFIFACFYETKNKFFRFISHRFASIFFAISLQTFCFKTKNIFFIILLLHFRTHQYIFFAILLWFFPSNSFFAIMCRLFCLAFKKHSRYNRIGFFNATEERCGAASFGGAGAVTPCGSGSSGW
jgi:hypothetical protein